MHLTVPTAVENMFRWPIKLQCFDSSTSKFRRHQRRFVIQLMNSAMAFRSVRKVEISSPGFRSIAGSISGKNSSILLRSVMVLRLVVRIFTWNCQGGCGKTLKHCCQNVEVSLANKTCFCLAWGRLDAINGITKIHVFSLQKWGSTYTQSRLIHRERWYN